MRNLSIIAAACLLLLCRLYFSGVEEQRYPDDGVVMVTARLTQQPEVRGSNQSFVLRVRPYEPLYVAAPLFPEYSYGQILTVSGFVTHSEGENIQFAAMRYPKVTVRENDSLLYGLMGFARQKVMRVYETALPQTSASLMMGIVFGIKQSLPQTFKDALSLTGVYHVVAASGMNVSLIAGAFMVVFGSFLKRQTALLFSIGGIIFYAILAGAEPSIVRASIMGSILFLAGIIGRQNLAFWSLMLTGYIMLMVNPFLIRDIGFQLSFLATFGILVFLPIIPDHLSVMSRSQKGHSHENEKVVIQDLKTTLAATLGTLPVLISAFGQVSLLSFPVNLLVLWTIPFIMGIGSVSALVGFLSEPLGSLIAYLALPFLLYFEWVVMFFSKYDFALRVESVSLWMAVCYYLVLLGIVALVSKRRNS